MELDHKWDWEKRKLACKVRIESGNPGADELRERICELIGMDYESFQRHFLADKQHAVKKTIPAKDEKNSKGNQASHGPEMPAMSRQAQSALRRINVSLNLFNQSDAVRPATVGKNTTTAAAASNTEGLGHHTRHSASAGGGGEQHGMPAHRKNINKKFIEVPKSPPRRALFDLKMERLQMAVKSVSMPAGGENGYRQGGGMGEGGEAFLDDGEGGGDHVSDAGGSLDAGSSVGSSSYTAGGAWDGGSSNKGGGGGKRSRRLMKLKKMSDVPNLLHDVPILQRVMADPKKLFKPYNGDIFGTGSQNEGGMIYLSRMTPHQHKPEQQPALPASSSSSSSSSSSLSSLSSPAREKEFNNLYKARKSQVGETIAAIQSANEASRGGAAAATSGSIKSAVAAAGAAGTEAGLPEPVHIDENHLNQQSFSGPSLKEMQAKLHCAQTLCNWTNSDANTERLYKEGAVQAIIRLSKENDRAIRRHCATAFRQMSTRPLLAKQLVTLGGVPIISEMINIAAGSSKQITIDCTVTLVNLTKNVGTEGKLVEDGIVLALMALPNDIEEWDELCARGLFNLTCVDSSYPFMERVIKAFMSLASSSFPSVKYICASALCNIADLKQMRMRMVEEGVIQVLGMLARGADIKTRRLCAIIIHSLAANKGVRAEMASRGAIQVIYSLSSDNDMTTLYCAASAILRLATEEGNAGRLITEGGISAISNVAIRCADVVSTSQACAGTLHLLSTRPDQRSTIVQEGCIPALITMLRTSTDYLTLHYSVLAICNLLTLEDNQLHIQQQGGVQTIVQLCRHEHPGIQKSCAFAIFTLSCEEAARKQAAASGAIPVIISLAKVLDEELKMYCAATLCMLSTDNEHINMMVKEGVIQTFIELLQSSDASTIRYSCAALCCLAYNNASCMHVLDQGAVPHVVSGALHGDENTRQSCCAVLSALSTHPECRQQLCDMNALPALMSLASMDDEMTRLRCAVAFANLSCESTAQDFMVKSGVVPILSDLSISYSEENQIYCAKALCNLACHIGSEQAMVEQGGMAALMMIGMVRAVSHQTKQICAKAILNLLTPQTTNRIAEDGLVTTCSTLSKMDDEDTMKACAHIFLSMSLETSARFRLINKVGALHALFRLMRSPDPTTKTLVGQVVCNLLSYEESREITVLEGGLDVVKEIASSGEPGPEIYATETLFRICDVQICRQKILETKTLPVIILLARSENQITRRLCIKILSILAWHLDSRPEFVRTNGVAALVTVLHRITQEGNLEEKQAVVELCVRSLFYLSLEGDYHEDLVRGDVLLTLLDMHKEGYLKLSTYEYTALMLRMLSKTEELRATLVNQGAFKLLCSTVESLSDRPDILFASTITLYNFAIETDLKAQLITKEVLAVIEFLSGKPNCSPVLSALLYVLSLEPSNRVPMAHHSSIPDVLCMFLDIGYKAMTAALAAPPQHTARKGSSGGMTEAQQQQQQQHQKQQTQQTQQPQEDLVAITQNSCATVLMLCKSPECRGRMQQANLVPLLIKLSKSKNAKICDSASQALNCLSENSNGGIEEGTVAALIAIALDGNAALKTEMQAEDYLQVPEMPDVEASIYAPKDDVKQVASFEGLNAHAQKMPAGPGGKGPKPPKPPSIMDDKRALTPGGNDEELPLEVNEEESTGVDKIMMFAKMDLPAKFLEQEASYRAIEQQQEQQEQQQQGELPSTQDLDESLSMGPAGEDSSSVGEGGGSSTANSAAIRGTGDEAAANQEQVAHHNNNRRGSSNGVPLSRKASSANVSADRKRGSLSNNDGQAQSGNTAAAARRRSSLFSGVGKKRNGVSEGGSRNKEGVGGGAEEQAPSGLGAQAQKLGLWN